MAASRNTKESIPDAVKNAQNEANTAASEESLSELVFIALKALKIAV